MSDTARAELDPAPPAPPSPATGAPPPAASTRAERWSDRLNPIFLRELQQAFSGKALVAVITVALSAIFLLGLMIALRPERAFENGREVFIPVLMVLTPLMTMVLPMHAFNSMQHELREGAVDQLLMSELTPRRIVRGKLLASALLAVIFMAVFAPLLAVTYLLRGIDVTTIAICLLFVFLGAMGTASVAMAMGAVTLIKPLQQLARVGVSGGLAFLTVLAMAGTWEVVRDVSRMRAPRELKMLVASGAGIAAGVVLMNMIAAAILTHPYENRSTPFRVFPFGLTALVYAMAWWVSPSDVTEFAWVWVMAGGIGALPFFVAALTEAPALSPRTRTLVPKNRALALLAAPFLPGGDRGLLFVLVLGGTLFGLAFAAESIGGRSVPAFVPAVAAIGACYVWIWACVLRLLRGNAPGQRPRVRAIAGAVVLLVLACALPAVYELAAHGGIEQWSWLHLGNPFFTIARGFTRGDSDVLRVLLAICGLLFLQRLRGMVAGIREVLEASRARAG